MLKGGSASGILGTPIYLVRFRQPSSDHVGDALNEALRVPAFCKRQEAFGDRGVISTVLREHLEGISCLNGRRDAAKIQIAT